MCRHAANAAVQLMSTCAGMLQSAAIVDQHATVNLYLSLMFIARHTLELDWIGRILHLY